MDDSGNTNHSAVAQSLGERLGHLRAQQELTCGEVARRARCSRGMISQMERGIRTPTQDLLLRWVAALGAEREWLFYLALLREKTQAERAAGTRSRGVLLYRAPAQRSAS